ncbi:tellurium resistance protein TerC [Striga asiatica]|uniref:Tellurium resistance protein TerC n=1 Tax=Striga asiatica TaxID=4170 RepID=A0A5A7QYQ7_STRAF|nr:tellurium resistance protein TerC [Striga asiatica]
MALMDQDIDEPEVPWGKLWKLAAPARWAIFPIAFAFQHSRGIDSSTGLQLQSNRLISFAKEMAAAQDLVDRLYLATIPTETHFVLPKKYSAKSLKPSHLVREIPFPTNPL